MYCVSDDATDWNIASSPASSSSRLSAVRSDGNSTPGSGGSFMWIASSLYVRESSSRCSSYQFERRR